MDEGVFQHISFSGPFRIIRKAVNIWSDRGFSIADQTELAIHMIRKDDNVYDGSHRAAQIANRKL